MRRTVDVPLRGTIGHRATVWAKWLRSRREPSTVLALALSLLAGCHHDMQDQPRYEPLEHSALFADGRSSRPLVPGTIPRGHLEVDQAYFAGREDGSLVDKLPVELTPALLERGQERYNIYCSPCHARTGDGNGMIVQRGYRRPPSYHTDRLRGMPVGHFFDVITRGFGMMPSYARQVPVEDRWAIVAYIRALQWSQYAVVDELSDADRGELPKEGQP
ncbi:MAG TPA: cytochrome c [Pirellulales bacterium]|nr:cytochrome c [Pirellulales bacterium]